MKFFLCFSAVLAIGSCIQSCEKPPVSASDDWITMEEPCVDSVRRQVQMELHASMQYLAMAAHFSKDTINRPGFAKFFFESASEEREHAIKLIHYLSMRGELTSKLTSLISVPVPAATAWDGGLSALNDSLKLEAEVTQSIRAVIETCESTKHCVRQCNEGTEQCKQVCTDFNDYHISDYLTGEFLEEQYKGQRELAGRVSTLGKMVSAYRALGDFMFDKKLLNGEM